MISSHLKRVSDALAWISDRQPDFVRVLPMGVRRRTNGSQGVTRGGRFARAKMAREQRSATRMLLGRRPLGSSDRTNIVVRMVRVSRGELDDDNLAGALKSARDGIADALGVDDRDERIVWLCDQEAGEAELRIELYEA